MWRYKTDRLGNPNPAVQRRIDKVGMVDLNYHESREHLGYCFLEWDKFVSVPVRQPRDFSKVSTKMKG